MKQRADKENHLVDKRKTEVGVIRPEVNLSKCEGKRDCAIVCPFAVFEIRPIDRPEKERLSFAGRMKTFFHGPNKAYVVRPEDCHACGLCVAACPEKAVRLIPLRG
ncbi:4Fe-4S dicluster domain-containing protein [Leptospira broomii]|nr:ferredoxin family protein [Leptospira broomii]